jgi:ribosome maturation factor RimP
MPVPPPEQVAKLLSTVIADAGCELDSVTVSAAGRRSVLRVVIDSEHGVDLDTVAVLTRAVSGALDAAPEVGESSYTLEVTTPGVDRPLTAERHWRRNRGRRVRVQLVGGEPGEELSARVGPVQSDGVLLVLPGATAPTVRTVAFTEVVRAVVEVEFAPPDANELALSGPPPAIGGPRQAAGNEEER